MNENHVNYIATRPGVALDKYGKHGLFGSVEGFTNNIDDLKKLKQHIYQKSKDKTIMYRGIISLKEEDALRLGYDNKEAWQEYLKNNVDIVSSQLGIKRENVQWVAAFHMDKGHPHVHFVLWDKEQEIKKAFVHWKTSNKIRVDLIKSIFANDLELLFKQKNEAKENVKHGFFDDFDNMLTDMSSKEFKRLKTKLVAIDKDLAIGKIPYTKYTNEQLAIFDDLIKLKSLLPPKGRLNYAFMSPEVKKEIDKITLKILEGNKEFSSNFNRYIDLNVEISQMYTNDENKLNNVRYKAYEDIKKIVGNSILKSFKKMNGKEWELLQDEIRHKMIIDLYFEIFSAISKGIEQKQAYLNQLRAGELSKQAKKELAIKLSSKGIDWEK